MWLVGVSVHAVRFRCKPGPHLSEAEASLPTNLAIWWEVIFN